MIEKVYLETDDEITSVIDKIRKTKTDKVEVIVPKRATLIQSIVNLKLLKRQSDFLNKKIVLFINDEKGINLANKAKLNIKTNISRRDLKHPKEEYIKNRDSKPNLFSKSKFENKEKKKTSSSAIEFLEKEIQNPKTEEPKPKLEKKFAFISKKISEATNGLREHKPEQKSKKEVNKFFKIGAKDKVHLLPSVNLRSFLIFFGISILVIALIFMMILPTATVIAKPKTEPFSTSFDVVISNNVDTLDIDNLIVPGETISHEEKSEKKKFKATGEEEIGEKARGEIIVYNSYSSDTVTLVPSTRFQSGDKVYYSLHEISIPGASIDGGNAVPGSAKVRVEAETEGEDYNINPSKFFIPNLSADRQQDIYGESSTAFTGGYSDVVKIVSEEDYENAKNELFESTFDNIVESFSKQMKDDKILAVGIMKKEITEINSSTNVGDEAEEFELEEKVRVVGYTVKENDVKAIINNKFTQVVPLNKFIIDDDITQGISFEPIEGVVSDEDSISAKINITKEVALKIDEKVIADAIKGKDPKEAEEYILQDESILDVEITLWPFWVQTVPRSVKKIKFTLDTDNDSDKLNDN